MNLIDFLDRLLASKRQQPPQPLKVIEEPDGVVVAKELSPYNVKHMYNHPKNMPGLCPICHNTINKIPNLDYYTNTKKDIALTYDGFYIVRERFKLFCEEQGFDDLTFIPLKNSPKHYYFIPNGIFSLDMELTTFEHEGKQCPECGGYRWFGSGGHSLYSKTYIGKEGNFIKRLNVLMGDHYQKFDSIIVGLKTAELMLQYGLKGFDFNDVLYVKHDQIRNDK